MLTLSPSRIFYNRMFPCDQKVGDRDKVMRRLKISNPSCDLIELKNTYALYVPTLHPTIPLIIYTHGNMSTLEKLVPQLYKMRDLCQMNICAYEFPPQPTTESINETIEELMNELIDKYDYEPSEIILWGKSIGTGATCLLSSKYEFMATVLVAPYVSIESMLNNVNFLIKYLLSEIME